MKKISLLHTYFWTMAIILGGVAINMLILGTCSLILSRPHMSNFLSAVYLLGGIVILAIIIQRYKEFKTVLRQIHQQKSR